MRNIKFAIIFIIITTLTVSCKDNSVKMGEVSYYPKFLWSAEKMDTLVKIYDFDFNDDAKAEPSCFAEFTFVDNNGEIISQDELIVYVDGEKTENNSFRVNNDEGSKELKFAFMPQAKNGKHQGYLTLTDHSLHIIDNQELQSNDKEVQVFQWTIHYNRKMNPLAKVLMWIIITIVAILFLWFTVFRPSLYPHFGKTTKTIIVKQKGNIRIQKKFNFKGSRKVIFTNKPIKQSLLKKIFIGKTQTWVDPLFVDQLQFIPQKKGEATAFGNNYHPIESTPIPRSGNIPRSGRTTIKNEIQKIEIILT